MYANKKTVVLIVGATGPVGSGIARQFAGVLAKDSQLIITSRSKDRLNSLKESLEKINPRITARTLQWDLTKPNTNQFRNDLRTSTTTQFENAIIVINAFDHGNLAHSILDIGENLPYLQENLNINVLSALTATSAFMELFGKTNHKVVVDVTAPSIPIASFGYNCISKAARKMAFDTLAKERNDIKVLYFQPGAVYTPAFDEIIKQTFNPELKAMFQAFVDNKETMCQTGDHIGRVLVNYIEQDKFESGNYVQATKEDVPEVIDTTISKLPNFTINNKN